jgi:hypothetical protein
MLVVNDTPFAFAPLSARVHWPDATLTLIVKGAFRLAHGARAEALEEQEPPLGDRFFDDDFAGECAYPSDFAPFKPRADLMLLGVARPRRATARATVALSVGDTSAKLEVIGDRYWADADTSTATKPLTFEVLPLRYTRAFGGDGHDHNPIGRGVFADKTRDPMLRPLPNIEWPDALVTDVASRPAPAGFGPLSSRWAARMQHAGTYDDGWLAERWPWFPADFDWSYFNAAPRPLQVEGYLRGDEAVALANLHVEHHAYHTQLPGLRLRCFLNETDGEQPDETTFREVDMNLDTLWIDAEAERLVLV